MLGSPDDTIAAIATAPAGAYRGIVRISGPGVVDCLVKCFRADGGVALPSIKTPTVVVGVLKPTRAFVDVPCDVYLWPSRRSYTRQPMAELHTVGSLPLLETILRTVCASGARPAQPGEFTLRAFLAGRLDLTRAEAVLGTIDASNEHEHVVALTQLAGGLSEPLGALRDDLLDLCADLEAGLDFVDEDIEFVTVEQLDRRLGEAAESIARLLDQMSSRHAAGGQRRVILVGSPNVGKSSLLNALAADQVALVSRHPGTTRDYLTCRVDLDGVSCEIIDTAGLDANHSPAEPVNALSQEMSAARQRDAHLRLVCLDSTRPLNAWEQNQLRRDELPRLLVLTKTDAARRIDLVESAIETSSRTGAGLETLRDAIRQRLSEASSESSVVAETVTRCRDSLRLAARCIRRARKLAVSGAGEELVAAELRVALDELGKIVGAVYTDDILDRVFGRFCIGK